MGIVNYTYNRSTSGGEIITHLINATDGEGLHFDGQAGTYVDCGDKSVLDTATTISVEVIAATSSTAVGRVLGKDSAASCFKLQANADGTLTFRVNNGSSDGTATTSGTYNDGNPKHIVGTWDGATVSIYVNGNLDGTATLAGGSIPNTTDKIALGAKLDSGTTNASNFNGIIYRARLFNYVIDPTRFYENATVPFDDQYGSQAILIGVQTGLDGWDADNTWNSQTTAGSNMILSASGANQYCRTNTTLGVGKKYRLTYTATGVYAESYFGGFWGGGYTNIAQVTDGTHTVDFTFESTSPFINDYFYCYSGVSTSTATLSNLSLVEIGCAVDLDLAFANPTQSLMVQDRAGNADGTSSATGVVQVTPIEQLNSKAARIGTSAATPADGDLLVSGNVGVGGTATDKLTLVDGQMRLTDTYGIRWGTNAVGIYGQATDNSPSGYGLKIYTAGVERLNINNAGKSTFTTAGVVPAVFQSTNASYGSIQLDNTATGGDNWYLMSTADGHVHGGGYFSLYNEDTTTHAIKVSPAGLATFANGIAVTGAVTASGTGYTTNPTGVKLGQFTSTVGYVQVPGGATGQLQVWKGDTGAIADFSSTGLAVTGAVTATTLSTFSNGIAFQSATTGTGTGTGYTLDSYEVGTFTPTGTGVTLTAPTGTYTKVGRVVTVNWAFVYASTSSGSAAAIGGLPFSVGTNYFNGGNQGYVNGSASASVAHITAESTNILYRTANGGVSLTHADLSGATIRGSMTYQTS